MEKIHLADAQVVKGDRTIDHRTVDVPARPVLVGVSRIVIGRTIIKALHEADPYPALASDKPGEGDVAGRPELGMTALPFSDECRYRPGDRRHEGPGEDEAWPTRGIE
jgi:hypothetical protein